MHSIFVIGGGDDEAVSFTTSEGVNDCRLTCQVRDEEHFVEAADFFEALRIIRRRVLEPRGLIPFCYGASLKVWPSAMGRDMARGLKAYRIEMGKAASELVGIFDSGPDVIPSSVSDQEDFARDWLASVRR